MKTQRYIHNVASSGLMLMVAIASIAAQAKTVEVPAGSVNALAAAIVEAGPHGTVVLQTGLHSESGEVSVTGPIRILGQPGAILETATSPATAFPLEVQAALHFKNAPGAGVEGIWFRPPGSTSGNCAVILEDSPGARVLGYDIELTGDTARFAPGPPLAAASYNNLVVAGKYQGIVVKDCGTGNVVHGAVTLVDTNVDPCY